MSEYKPLEEYYLHDHGDGNGWQVLAKHGKWGVATSGSIEESDGVIGLEISRFWTGGIGTSEEDFFVLTPEEAHDIGHALVKASEEGYGIALSKREKTACS